MMYNTPVNAYQTKDRKDGTKRMEVTRTELFPGVHLTAVHTDKFKSAVLGLQFLLPLEEQTASCNALVPAVLRRGTEAHPDMEALSAALDELYGGALEPMVRKKGETQCVGFVGSFLDDAYTLEGEPLLERAAALLGELVLSPRTQNGRFTPEYLEGEKANLIDRIRAQVNDKRQYAQIRVVAEMCAGEPFGVDKLGSEESAAAITNDALWDCWQAMLNHAPVELYYCGSASGDRVQSALSSALADLPKGAVRTVPARPAGHAAPAEPKVVEEALDVTQGKLSMGFRTGCDAWSEDYPALTLVNAVYGGTTTSKLFMNVRERLSLCYYASSGLMKYKDVMLVASGVEFGKVEEAKREILAQLAACQKGEFSDEELEWARRSVVSTLRTTLDSQGRLEDYWLGQSAAGLSEDPEALAQRVERVSREQVTAAAQKLALDTVYFLKGKE